MNYIKQLQKENAEMQAAILATDSELLEFKRFLMTDKFNGVCPIDGSRKDWMSTMDIHTKLESLRNTLFS